MKEGQYTEEEILDNNEHSENFEEFLTILGDKVNQTVLHGVVELIPPDRCGCGGLTSTRGA